MKKTKKLLFAAHDMNLGGIETSLVNLLNYLAKKNYEITLVLENKEGIFLDTLDKKIEIIEYQPCKDENFLKRKCKNMVKRVRFMVKYKNRFDFSASFATYSLMSSFVARVASKNNALWGHADYLALYKGDEEKVKKFFKDVKYNQFRKIVFVSKVACHSFLQIYPQMKKRVIYCNNIINQEKIKQLALENAQIKETKKQYTFVNIGRHDEQQKKLTRLIEAAKRLKEEELKFRILLVGEGTDSNQYKELVDKNQLEDNIVFVGQKKNPYPYIRISDCTILTSDYEGYPVVFTESMILNKPIITTDVSDAREIIDNQYGTVVTKEVEEIYKAMKQYILKKGIIPKKFSPEEYNKEIEETLEKIISKKLKF